MAYRCAILDDYQNVALKVADWSKLKGDVEVKVFNEALGPPDKVIAALKGINIVCLMRERTLYRAAWQDGRYRRARQTWGQGRADRQGARYERDRVEPESHHGQGRGGRREAREQGGAFPAIGFHHRASAVEPAHARPDRS